LRELLDKFARNYLESMRMGKPEDPKARGDLDRISKK
jgi:hypothetical protein